MTIHSISDRSAAVYLTQADLTPHGLTPAGRARPPGPGAPGWPNHPRGAAPAPCPSGGA